MNPLYRSAIRGYLIILVFTELANQLMNHFNDIFNQMDNLNGIYIIDCSDISGKPLAEIQDTEEFKVFAENFGNAMKLNGIVYLINTGIEKIAIEFEEKLAEFYSLPLETKKKYETVDFVNFRWGWRASPTSCRETIDFVSNLQYDDNSMYPKEVIGFKEALLTFRKSTKYLSTKLLRSLGEYLKLEDKDIFIRSHSALEENYGKSNFSVRSLYYPVKAEIQKDSPEFRLVPHQDIGTLTHLYQNSGGGGLQAKLHTGNWVDVEYIPNSLVVNAGRSLEMWSGGNIPAVIHRVGWTERSKTASRISFGMFLSPDNDSCCLPLVKENPHWKTIYAKMQPGEIFGDYFKVQIKFVQIFPKDDCDK